MSNDERTMGNDEPRIYVACLAAYNNGKLHGAWIDATLDPEDIADEVEAMLAKSPEAGAEEWAIHDFDNFGSVKIDEHDSFEHVHEIAACIQEVGLSVVESAIETFGEHYVVFEEDWIRERLQAEIINLADWAYDWHRDIGVLPSVGGDASAWSDGAAFYVDWEKVARDMEINGGISYDEKRGIVWDTTQ